MLEERMARGIGRRCDGWNFSGRLVKGIGIRRAH
jgi:hypothetical protein